MRLEAVSQISMKHLETPDLVFLHVPLLSEDLGSKEGGAGMRIWISNLARQGSVPAIFSPNLVLREAKGLYPHCCDFQ